MTPKAMIRPIQHYHFEMLAVCLQTCVFRDERSTKNYEVEIYLYKQLTAIWSSEVNTTLCCFGHRELRPTTIFLVFPAILRESSPATYLQ